MALSRLTVAPEYSVGATYSYASGTATISTMPGSATGHAKR